MFKTDSEKIIVISSPRTGSTALAEAIANDNNKVFYNEPGHDKISFESFMDIQSDPTSKFVLKVQAHSFYEQLYHKSLRKDDQIQWIRIRRKNIIDQIASNYVALKRKKWLYDENGYDINVIEIDDTHILMSMWSIKRFNRYVNEFEVLQCIKFDKEFWYEDIEDELRLRTDLMGIPTPLPENYDELLLNIKKLL